MTDDNKPVSTEEWAKSDHSSRRRRTHKPCPGCGETEQGHINGYVCSDCQRALRFAYRVNKIRAARQGNITVLANAAGYLNTGYYCEVGVSHWCTESRSLAQAMADLLFAVSEPTEDDTVWVSADEPLPTAFQKINMERHDSDHDMRTPRVLTKAAWEAFHKLDQTIRTVLPTLEATAVQEQVDEIRRHRDAALERIEVITKKGLKQGKKEVKRGR